MLFKCDLINRKRNLKRNFQLFKSTLARNRRPIQLKAEREFVLWPPKTDVRNKKKNSRKDKVVQPTVRGPLRIDEIY